MFLQPFATTSACALHRLLCCEHAAIDDDEDDYIRMRARRRVRREAVNEDEPEEDDVRFIPWHDSAIPARHNTLLPELSRFCASLMRSVSTIHKGLSTSGYSRSLTGSGQRRCLNCEFSSGSCDKNHQEAGDPFVSMNLV